MHEGQVSTPVRRKKNWSDGFPPDSALATRSMPYHHTFPFLKTLNLLAVIYQCLPPRHNTWTAIAELAQLVSQLPQLLGRQGLFAPSVVVTPAGAIGTFI